MADRDEIQRRDSATTGDRAGAPSGERRDDARAGFEGLVEMEFLDSAVVGRGQNKSAQGVFFHADTLPRVRVRTADGERIGELVRVQPQGDGTAGIAIRLLD